MLKGEPSKVDKIIADFGKDAVKADKKESHLWRMKIQPNPNGNRAERRAAKRFKC